METRHRSPMRVLAPAALVVFGLALVLVITTSGGGGDERATDTSATQEARDLGTDAKEEKAKQRESSEDSEPSEEGESGEQASGKAVYVVQEGDTLGAIAEETGVPIERLEELNPGLDQFSLVAGQRIKLR